METHTDRPRSAAKISLNMGPFTNQVLGLMRNQQDDSVLVGLCGFGTALLTPQLSVLLWQCTVCRHLRLLVDSLQPW